MGNSYLQMEGDAKRVVDAVNSKEADESGWGHLVADIRSTLQMFPSWRPAQCFMA
jgi:hypothetical protein